MRFRVIGASRATGQDIEQVVEATSWLAAEAFVAHEMLVERVEPLQEMAEAGPTDQLAAAVAMSAGKPPRAPTTGDPWPTLDGNPLIVFWIVVGGFGLVAFSPLMNWVSIFAGGIAGIVYPLGKIIGGSSVLFAIMLLGTRWSKLQFTLIVGIASAWASFVAVIMLIHAYRVIDMPEAQASGGGFGLMLATQVGVGGGCYAALLGSAAAIIGLAYIYRMSGFDGHGKPRTWGVLIVAYAIGVVAASTSVAALPVDSHGEWRARPGRQDDPLSRNDSPKFSVQPRRYSIPGSLLEWCAWEISNDSNAPLTIKHVYLNGEYDAPLAIEPPLTKQFCEDKNSPLPATVSIGDSLLFFERDPSDKESYWKNVIFLDIETDRGNFRFTPPGEMRELTSDEEDAHAQNVLAYQAEHAKELTTMKTPAEVERAIALDFGGMDPNGQAQAPPAAMVQAEKKQLEARQQTGNSH